MAEGAPKKPGFGKVIAKAVSSPLNLGVAGTAGVAAVALHLWPLAAIGGAAYAALVAWDLVSPDFWKKALGEPPPLRPLRNREEDGFPDPTSLKDPILRESAQTILAARAELDRTVGAAEGDVSVQMAGVMVSINELQDRAARLIERGEEVARYLARSETGPVRKEISRLAERREASKDEQARAEYERAIGARKEQLETLDEIQRAQERVHANLSRIVATFEGLSAKVVRMGAMDAQAMDDLSGDMNAELERMNGEIRTFEETLKQLSMTQAH